MKDGTIRDNIDGVVVPFEANKPVYDILKEIHKQGVHYADTKNNIKV
jgi:hypothetical protein